MLSYASSLISTSWEGSTDLTLHGPPRSDGSLVLGYASSLISTSWEGSMVLPCISFLTNFNITREEDAITMRATQTY